MLKRHQITAMNITYMFFSFDTFLDDMQSLGFKNLELWGGSPHFYPDRMTPKQIESIQKTINARGMACDIYTPEQCMYPYNIAAEESDIAHYSIAYFCNALRYTRDLGASKMLITPGWGYFDKPMVDAWNRSVDSLYQLACFAKKCGITLLLEPLRAAESNLVTNLPRLVKMLSDVGHKSLKGMIDTIPMAQAGESIIDYHKQLGNDLLHIHFIDGTPSGHLPWGDGNLPLQKYVDEITAINYENALTLEIVSDFEAPRAAYTRALKALAPFLED